MDKKEMVRQEEIDKSIALFNDKYELAKVEGMIKDNKINFTYKDKEYRVRLLNQKDKDDLDLLRRKKFGQLIQDKDILFEKTLIALYKEKGISIEELTSKLNKLNTELHDKCFKLGEYISKGETESVLNTYREEIEEITNNIYTVTVQKSHLLEFSLEKQLEHFTIKILSYLSLEVKADEKYVKAFDTLEKFLVEDEELVEQTVSYAVSLNYKL